MMYLSISGIYAASTRSKSGSSTLDPSSTTSNSEACAAGAASARGVYGA